MPESLSQANRIGKLTTPLAADVLVLSRFDGVDAVDDLFEFHVEALSLDPDIQFDELLGMHCSVELACANDVAKFYDGIVSEMEAYGEVGDRLYGYHLTLRPCLWLLTLRRNSRIFHEKTVNDILSELFSEYGFTIDDKAAGASPQLEYTVQFNETDYEFARRLMARFGISFHFSASAAMSHKIILTSHNSDFVDIAGAERRFNPYGAAANLDHETFTTFGISRRVTTGKVAVSDYNFLTPSVDMLGQSTGDASHSNNTLESYEFPGNHLDSGAGTNVAAIRVRQFRATDKRYSASGPILSLSAGQKVKLKNHPTTAWNDKKYIALRSVISLDNGSYISGEGSAPSIQGSYEFVEDSVPYAPPRIQTRQQIIGVQTAVVVGGAGDGGSVDCDYLGRIRVKFHWDRNNDYSVNARVATLWAGQEYGSMYIPRVGMEVLVQFINGDADLPVVIGCVYNEEYKPPYAKSDDSPYYGSKTQFVGGGGYSEWYFNDVSANDGGIWQYTDGHYKTETQKDEDHKIHGKRTTTIDSTDTLKATGKITIESDAEIELKVAGSTIKITSSAIEIKSLAITASATGELKAEGAVSAKLTSSGIVTVQGSLVKIN